MKIILYELICLHICTYIDLKIKHFTLYNVVVSLFLV